MAILGGGKKRKLRRAKNKTETVTINADGSRTVTVTKNKTRTRETQPTKRTTRKKVSHVSTLKPYEIEEQKITILKPKINAKPLKERPKKVKAAQARNVMRGLLIRADRRESQPLAPSPKMRNSVPNGRGQ